MSIDTAVHAALPKDVGNAVPDIPSETKSLVPSEAVEYDFLHGFLAAFSMIVVSELGDKTFFISAILAMKYSRLIVYAGAMTALAGMHVLSGKCDTRIGWFSIANS